MAKVVVVGSLNCDVTVRMKALPRAEETILGHEGSLSMGGKGQNQVIAASRFGADAAIVGMVGGDAMGEMARANLIAQGVDIATLETSRSSATGCAAVLISEDGSNMIAVAPGANHCLRPEHLERARAKIEDADVIVLQLEIPFPTIRAALDMARAANVRAVMNPAPADARAIELLALADVVTPNEPELETLTGMTLDGSEERLREAMQSLIDKGARQVVVTLGGDGCAAWDGTNFIRLPAFKVDVVDVNGAGDVFNGVLASCLGDGMEIEAAMRHASGAAAISVTRRTSGGAPDRARVEALLADA